MRDLKINNKKKPLGGCPVNHKKKYDRELGRYTCVKVEKTRKPKPYDPNAPKIRK
mgnify:FL=1